MNFKKIFIYFLSTIDIYDFPITSLFNFKGNTTYSTAASKFMTVLVIALSFASFFYFVDNMKNNPTTGYKEDFIVDADEVAMSSENFFFSFSMEDPRNVYLDYIDSTVYIVQATFSSWNYGMKETTYNYHELEIEPCNLNHIPKRNELKEAFLSKNYTKNYCIKDYSKIKIKGAWASGSIQSIDLAFRPCNNKTENNTCKSPEFISKMIERSFVSIYYTSVSPKLEDYYEPLKYNFIYDYYQTSMELSNSVDIFFGLEKIETNSGFFVQETSYNVGVTYIKSRNLNFVNKYDTTYLYLSITLDPLVKIYSRKYESIIDVLSKMGGIIKILSIFATLILKPFFNSAVMQRISNETFDYDEVRDLKHNGKPITKITLSFWEFIKSKLLNSDKLSSNTKIMMNSIKKIKENLDISFFINKMFDIEKIKVIFDKELQFIKDEKPKIIPDRRNLSSTVLNEFQKKFIILPDFQNDNIGILNEFSDNENLPNSEEKNNNNEMIPIQKIESSDEKERIFQDKGFWTIEDDRIEEKKINSIKNGKISWKKGIKTEI